MRLAVGGKRVREPIDLGCLFVTRSVNRIRAKRAREKKHRLHGSRERCVSIYDHRATFTKSYVLRLAERCECLRRVEIQRVDGHMGLSSLHAWASRFNKLFVGLRQLLAVVKSAGKLLQNIPESVFPGNPCDESFYLQSIVGIPKQRENQSPKRFNHVVFSIGEQAGRSEDVRRDRIHALVSTGACNHRQHSRQSLSRQVTHLVLTLRVDGHHEAALLRRRLDRHTRDVRLAHAVSTLR